MRLIEQKALVLSFQRDYKVIYLFYSFTHVTKKEKVYNIYTSGLKPIDP